LRVTSEPPAIEEKRLGQSSQVSAAVPFRTLAVEQVYCPG
jgi:hypothetical protein